MLGQIAVICLLREPDAAKLLQIIGMIHVEVQIGIKYPANIGMEQHMAKTTMDCNMALITKGWLFNVRIRTARQRVALAALRVGGDRHCYIAGEDLGKESI